jgi:uncharacterized protein (DUF433 family)
MQGDYHIILEQTMSLYARNRVRKEPGICGGALSIPEERMPVSFILRCFAAGMSQREMLRAYPAAERRGPATGAARGGRETGAGR